MRGLQTDPGSSPLPSCVLPQPETTQRRPTGNFWMASGRHTGWMNGLKPRGLASSSTATSKSRMPGLYWGCSTALLSPTFTGVPPMPARDAVPSWARTSSTLVLPTGAAQTPAGTPAAPRELGGAPWSGLGTRRTEGPCGCSPKAPELGARQGRKPFPWAVTRVSGSPRSRGVKHGCGGPGGRGPRPSSLSPPVPRGQFRRLSSREGPQNPSFSCSPCVLAGRAQGHPSAQEQELPGTPGRGGDGPYWLKQWAADSSQRSPTTVAPQKCREPSFRLTCQGTSPEAAPSPPTIRVGFSMAGLAPHSARDERRGSQHRSLPRWEHRGSDTRALPPRYTDEETEA